MDYGSFDEDLRRMGVRPRRYGRSGGGNAWKAILVGGALVLGLGGCCVLTRGSTETVTLTVQHRERVVDQNNSKYLVWSEDGEVFSVQDSATFSTWDASDRYGRLRPGARCQVKVAGWRIPLFSTYRNIYEVETCVPWLVLQVKPRETPDLLELHLLWRLTSLVTKQARFYTVQWNRSGQVTMLLPGRE